MKLKFLIPVIALWITTACHTARKTTPPQPKVAASTPAAPTSSIVGITWTLEKLNGHKLEIDSNYKEDPYFEIKDKMYFGYSGCNQMHGNLDLTETTIRFHSGPMTRKACIEGNIEPAFLVALSSCVTYKIVQGKLELFDVNGKQLCVFRK